MQKIKSKENISADQYATDKITAGSKNIKTKIRKAPKRSIKTIKKAQKTTNATIKTTKTVAKTSVKAAKLTVKGTIAAVKGLIATVKGISTAIAAGGWAAVVIILVVCIVAFIITGTLGAFDLDESDNSGILPEEVLEELIEDYKSQIEQDYRVQFPEMEVILNEENFDVINRENVIAAFKARVIYENWSMMDKIRMDVVQEALGDLCVRSITGSVSPGQRQIIIDEFTGSYDKNVLICQVQAGGVGLNIQAASVVVFCEPQIKPALESQVISRAYRMGQINKVVVHRLLT